jgi:hypothetical protein
MAAHAARIGRYMAAGGVRSLMVNAQDWDSPEALRAYRCYARHIPGLLGVLAVQYYPYTGGGGEVRWVRDGQGREVPVVSARFALWSHANRPRDGGPRRVAQFIRDWAETPVTQPEDRFGWVVDHCWSWFRRIGPGEPVEQEEVEQRPSEDPDVARGYRPAMWCAEAISDWRFPIGDLPSGQSAIRNRQSGQSAIRNPQSAIRNPVRVVTPEELLLRLRLSARPVETLRGWLAEVRQDYALRRAEPNPSPALERAARDLWAAHRALQVLERRRTSAEAAFIAIQRANRAIYQVAPNEDYLAEIDS